MRVNHQYFLIEIDKKAQAKAKEVLPGVKIADTMTLMKYYLQCGPILQIGKDAKASFPEAEVGDIMIFRHTVEDDEWREIYKDDNVSWRLLQNDGYDILGVKKKDGTIIPEKGWLFCKEIKKPAGWAKINGLFRFTGAVFDTAEDIHARIDELDNQIKYLAESSGDVGPKIEQYKKEQQKLTKMLNMTRIKETELIYIHPDTRHRFKNVADHSTILFEGWIDYNGYPLTFEGIEYYLIKTTIVVGHLVKNAEEKVSVALL